MLKKCNTAFFSNKRFEDISQTLRKIQDLEVKTKSEKIYDIIDPKIHSLFWADFEKKNDLNKLATTPEEIRKVKLYEEIMEYRGYSYFLKDTKTNDIIQYYSPDYAATLMKKLDDYN